MDAVKDFFVINLIFMLTLSAGCGSDDKASPTIKSSDVSQEESRRNNPHTTGIILKGSIWVEYDNLKEFVNSLKHKDSDHLEEMLKKRKLFKITQDTKVLSSESGIYNGICFVTFLEGAYTDKSGYTVADFVKTARQYEELKKKDEIKSKQQYEPLQQKEKSVDEIQILRKEKHFSEGMIITIPLGTKLILGDSLSGGVVQLPESAQARVIARNGMKNPSVSRIEFLEGSYVGQHALIFANDYILAATR